MFKNAERSRVDYGYTGELNSPRRYKLMRLGDDQAKMSGVEGGFGTILSEDDQCIVIRFKGYSYNPGSRYSGLKSYQPAETYVLLKGEDDWYYYLSSWENRKKKKA